jgi:hypothetical protein
MSDIPLFLKCKKIIKYVSKPNRLLPMSYKYNRKYRYKIKDFST